MDPISVDVSRAGGGGGESRGEVRAGGGESRGGGGEVRAGGGESRGGR